MSVSYLFPEVSLMCYRIGNLLGEGKAKRAGMAAKTSLVIALAISALTR